MKILCPTDLQPVANNATVYAAKLCQQTGAVLTLIHLRILADLTVEEALYGEVANVETAEKILQQLSAEVARTFKISCDYIASSAVSGLTNNLAGEANDYDLIVMGTHGTNGIFETISGSKSYQVAMKSSTPVLLVPEESGYSEITNIAYAFDYGRNDIPLAQVKKFAAKLHTGITVLVIVDQYSRKNEVEMQQKADQIKVKQDDVALRFKTLFASDLQEALLQYYRSEKVDLLVMHSRSHSLLERIFNRHLIKEVTKDLRYPLLVVHE